MMKQVALALLAVSVQASTKVAVLEFGKAGSVRRALSESSETTVDGVVSFWSALHSSGMQHPGMSVVPDFFRKPDSSVVVGISGGSVNFKQLNSDIVAEMEIDGKRCHKLLSSVPAYENVDMTSLVSSAVSKGLKSGLSGVHTVIDSTASVDKQVSMLLTEFKKLAESNDQTIVLHLVVEDDDSTRRRLTERNLEDEQGEEENDQAENDQDEKEYSGYYGYGYYDSNGVWVTPFKTMFQIQYFNVVMWTSLGLFGAIFYAIFLMVNMPLEADTLLFGESAKLVGDD